MSNSGLSLLEMEDISVKYGQDLDHGDLPENKTANRTLPVADYQKDLAFWLARLTLRSLTSPGIRTLHATERTPPSDADDFDGVFGGDA